MKAEARNSKGALESILLLIALACLTCSPALAEDETPLARLFDTGAGPASVLTAEVLARRNGWNQVPEDQTNHQFAGDAVLMNDKLAVAFGKQVKTLGVFSRTAEGLMPRVAIGYAAGPSSLIIKLEGFKIVENTSAGVVVEASFKSSETAVLRFRLTAGEAILEIQTVSGNGFIDVQSKTRLVVVPDYFGDDMVYGADAPHGLCLPTENFCLNLIEGGNAIVMAVWRSRDQEAWLAQRSEAGCSSRVRSLKAKSIWLAFLESPGIWHSSAVAEASSKSWKAQFPAKWRSSYVRANGVADSWDTEQGASAEQTAGLHQGPVVTYPIDRSPATPLTVTCPTDVMRNTLGVGPCQYILACEGLATQGDPTPNSVMTWVEKQFEQKKEKKVADDIKERLNQMVQHVADARLRIERYSSFGTRVRQSLGGKPGAAAFSSTVDELERLAAAGLTAASSPEQARRLADEVAGLIGRENALATCQAFGARLRAIGSIQDHALAKCRMVVRSLQAESRTIAAQEPAEAGVAREVGGLTEQMLQNK